MGDITLSFWRFAMVSLVVVAVALPFVHDNRQQVMTAMLFQLGSAASVISGMLYKVAVFGLVPSPGVETNPDRDDSEHETIRSGSNGTAAFVLHVAGVLLCLSATWLPWLAAQVGLILLMMSCGLLWLILVRARRSFLACEGGL